MEHALISLRHVNKSFKLLVRKKGFAHAVKSFFKPEYERKHALDDISFEIQRGELVGYIGANGAGKSTTIKILSGILMPTSGEVLVHGRDPHTHRKENAMRIGVVFGQRSQLYWDLPMLDTFQLYRRIFKIEDGVYKRNVDMLIELLDMKDFLDNQVRQLSLGQKMRGEIAVSLLHDPEILYLDEPTIGLDIFAKKTIRSFIPALNREKKTTVILTTHDMDDIEQICSRIIMIDRGKKIYDGSLDSFKETFSPGHMVSVDFTEPVVSIDEPRLTVVKEDGLRKEISYNKKEISTKEVINYITSTYEISDISIKEPDVEDVVRAMYKG